MPCPPSHRVSRVLAAFAVLLALAAPFASWAAAEQRVALVIGNAAYTGGPPLANPVNDATDMAAKLRSLGFDVILRTDADYQGMRKALTDFGRQLKTGGVGLFFYAGHGMQVKGRNYLLPVDARIQIENDVGTEALDVDFLLDKLTPARVSIVILDACRNNPFERRFRGGGQGLAQINAPSGTLIAYATAPGKVAADGEGRNGLYTGELLKALATPGAKVEDVFKRVRANVLRSSGEAQTPWESSSLTGDFYFASRPAETAEPMPASSDPEDALWKQLTPARPCEYQAYLDQFPQGRFAPLAKLRLKDCPMPAVAAKTVPASPGRASATPVPVIPEQASGDSFPTAFAQIDRPSFDCGGTLKSVETLICSDRRLARADGVMGAAYQRLRSLIGPGEKDALRDRQRGWLKERDRACPVAAQDLQDPARRSARAECLYRLIEARALELHDTRERRGR